MRIITCAILRSFHFHSHDCLRFCGRVVLALAWLALNAAQAQNYTLGTTALVEGPAAGSNSVVLGATPATVAWTATANAPWLHLSLANQSGTGNDNVVFSYDANLGPTRSGTLTIGGGTVTVTQAGSTYVATGQVTTLASLGPEQPFGIAVDSSGRNVHFSVRATASNLPPFTISGTNAILKWGVTNNTLTALVSSGLGGPEGVAVDGAGNVYIADMYNSAIKEWAVTNGSVTTLVSSSELYGPMGVALDGAGNVYIADGGQSRVKEWMVSNSYVTTWVGAVFDGPGNVAVDGSGNIYYSCTYNFNSILEWSATDGNLTTLVSSGLNLPRSFAVDGSGNLYIADSGDNAIKELPRAFVDPTPKVESLAAGQDALPMVLPVTENLLPPFAPTSDQSWLTITGITNGVVSFSFTADSGPARTAHITLLGQSIPITQGVIGTTPVLTGARMLGKGVLQFACANVPAASLTVLSTTNLLLPFSNWTVVGIATNTVPGLFLFTSQPTTNDAQRFYGVRTP